MKMTLLTFVLAAYLFASSGALSVEDRAVVDPFVLGDYPVNSTAFQQIINPFLDLNLDVYAPNAPGNFPVFYFVSGFGGIMPIIAYSQFMTHVASHGFVAVGVWKLDNPINSFNVTWFDATVDFVENQLETSLHLKGFNIRMKVDYLNSFIGAHSAGAHVPVAQFEAHCLNFKGQLLYDPVDGADPLGINQVFVITPGEKVNFTVPTMQIVCGLDPIASNVTGGPCAPEVLSGKRFFDAMNGPIWWLNATAYGHADFLDPFYENIVEVTQFCTTNPDTPKDPYIRFVAGESVAFMFGILDPVANCDYFKFLETSGNAGIYTENEYRADDNWTKCTPTRCIL